MRYRKALILLTPLFILGLYELFYLKPELIYIWLLLSNLALLFTIRSFSKFWNVSNWWDYCILPVFFVSSLAIYVSLLISKTTIQFLFFINFVFIFYYLKNAYFYFAKKEKGKALMQNFSALGSFLVVFFVSASIFGLHLFLNVSLWLSIFIYTVIILMLVYSVFITNQIKIRQNIYFIFLITLIMAEIFYVISFLPFSYKILGLTVAICYYISIGILKFHLKNSLTQKAVKLYLTAGIASILVLFLSAQWL